MHCDRKSAIVKAKNKSFNGKNRHIQLRHNVVKHLLKDGAISINYVRSEVNLADPLCSRLIQRILGPLLRPNKLQSPSSMFGSVACDKHLLREGGARSKGDRFERTLNVSLHILHVPAINSLAVTLPTIS
jgi:hypothetical protein